MTGLALRPRAPRFVHGDLQAAHVFVDGDEVSGVLDWSEAGQGDAMYDLASLTLGHPEHLDDVLEGIARGITDPDRQGEALGVLARTMGTVDRPRALALAEEVEQDVRAQMSAEPLSRIPSLQEFRQSPILENSATRLLLRAVAGLVL